MRLTKDTRTHLVQELEARRSTPATPRWTSLLERVIAEAKAGEFHDFKSEKYAMPKVALVNFLLALQLNTIARDVRDGVYDETPDEADRAEMREGLPPELWKTLGLEPREVH